jgi:Putative DNA-binding domain
MSILRKPLSEITIDDLQNLITAEARETGELEFKGALPFQPQKGQPQIADRWIEKGDRIGDYARDEILAELTAFANAEGGTLVLGLHETKDEPRRAERLDPLPNCERLVRRLLDASEDIVEPRLRSIEARALPVDTAGSGYVVLRVGKSAAGPHRLRSTREFYIRRGERAAKMDVREIKDLTLNLARTGDRIEQVFQERRDLAATRFRRLMKAPDKGGPGPLILRSTGVPMTIQSIPDITSRHELWWTGNAFTMMISDENYACDYPARNFSDPPQIRLRSLVADSAGTLRFVRGDGLVEFSLILPKRATRQNGTADHRVYIGWLMSVLVGTLAQINKLRANLAWDAAEFGLELEIQSPEPLAVRWNDDGLSEGWTIHSRLPLLLPQYSVMPGANLDAILNDVLADLFNSTGSQWNERASAPWGKLADSG